MIYLKSGDTDGTVTFAFRAGSAVADLTGRTVGITLASASLGIRHEIASLTVLEPATGGKATWQPSDADWAVLLPATYRVEAIATGAGGVQRAYPTRGYDTIVVEARL
jgi:hypothetical protein